MIHTKWLYRYITLLPSYPCRCPPRWAAGPNAQGFLRLSTASNMEQLTAGLECIKLTLEQIRSGSAAMK